MTHDKIISDNVKKVVDYYVYNGLFEFGFIKSYVEDNIILTLSKEEVEQIYYILDCYSGSYMECNNRAAGDTNYTYTPKWRTYDEIITIYNNNK